MYLLPTLIGVSAEAQKIEYLEVYNFIYGIYPTLKFILIYRFNYEDRSSRNISLFLAQLVVWLPYLFA